MKIKDMSDEQIEKVLGHNCDGVNCFKSECFLCLPDRRCVAVPSRIRQNPDFDIDLEKIK